MYKYQDSTSEAGPIVEGLVTRCNLFFLCAVCAADWAGPFAAPPGGTFNGRRHRRALQRHLSRERETSHLRLSRKYVKFVLFGGHRFLLPGAGVVLSGQPPPT